mmetsp:Transcript_66010/g.137507  ORF Transcript_66010/g.137507 Transcript_66010/m.137507 type:complete len:87 (+) Transcript_66010:610-870(+)
MGGDESVGLQHLSTISRSSKCCSRKRSVCEVQSCSICTSKSCELDAGPAQMEGCQPLQMARCMAASNSEWPSDVQGEKYFHRHDGT